MTSNPFNAYINSSMVKKPQAWRSPRGADLAARKFFRHHHHRCTGDLRSVIAGGKQGPTAAQGSAGVVQALQFDMHRIPAQYVEPDPASWVLSRVDLRSTAMVRIFRDCLVERLAEALGVAMTKLLLCLKGQVHDAACAGNRQRNTNEQSIRYPQHGTVLRL